MKIYVVARFQKRELLKTSYFLDGDKAQRMFEQEALTRHGRGTVEFVTPAKWVDEDYEVLIVERETED